MTISYKIKILIFLFFYNHIDAISIDKENIKFFKNIDKLSTATGLGTLFLTLPSWYFFGKNTESDDKFIAKEEIENKNLSIIYELIKNEDLKFINLILKEFSNFTIQDIIKIKDEQKKKETTITGSFFWNSLFKEFAHKILKNEKIKDYILPLSYEKYTKEHNSDKDKTELFPIMLDIIQNKDSYFIKLIESNFPELEVKNIQKIATIQLNKKIKQYFVYDKKFKEFANKFIENDDMKNYLLKILNQTSNNVKTRNEIIKKNNANKELDNNYDKNSTLNSKITMTLLGITSGIAINNYLNFKNNKINKNKNYFNYLKNKSKNFIKNIIGYKKLNKLKL